MSLSKEAIIRIEELSSAGSDLPVTDFSKAAIPSGVTINDLEPYQRLRNQFRGTMSTESIKDFLSYCNSQDKGVCFINRSDMAAQTIFDIGTHEAPGHCKHKAIIELKQTASFKALLLITDVRISQSDLAEFIEDWKDFIKISDADNESINISAAIGAVRKVTIDASSKSEHNEGSFSSSSSVMDKMDASSDGKNLPSHLDFTCKPYDGLEEFGFSLRVRVIVTGKKPEFILRHIKFDEVMEKVSDSFKNLITSGDNSLGDKIPHYMGFFSGK